MCKLLDRSAMITEHTQISSGPTDPAIWVWYRPTVHVSRSGPERNSEVYSSLWQARWSSVFAEIRAPTTLYFSDYLACTTTPGSRLHVLLATSSSRIWVTNVALSACACLDTAASFSHSIINSTTRAQCELLSRPCKALARLHSQITFTYPACVISTPKNLPHTSRLD